MPSRRENARARARPRAWPRARNGRLAFGRHCLMGPNGRQSAILLAKRPSMTVKPLPANGPGGVPADRAGDRPGHRQIEIKV
jgi:hypothetical protein